MHDLFNDPPCPARSKVATNPPQNLNNINWMDLLEPMSRIPPDVSFKILERPNNNEGEGEEKVMGEVPFLLARLLVVLKLQYAEYIQ